MRARSVDRPAFATRVLAPLVLATLASSARAQNVKVSELSPPIVGDTQVFQLSPDGARLVYSADQDTDQIYELYSAPSDGSQAPVKLSIPISSGSGLLIGGNFPGFQVAPGGTRVVYVLLGASPPADYDLYSVPIDGGGPSVKLDAPLESIIGFGIAPDTERVVYRAHGVGLDVHELYSVPIDGSQARVKLNGALAPGGDVQGESLGFPTVDTPFERYVQFTPDGEGLVYLADQSTNDVFDLFAVPTDGSLAPVKLTSMSGARDASSGYRITPDGVRVVYMADQDTDEVIELYSVPLEGSKSPVKLSGTIVAAGDVRALDVSPFGGRAVYVADQDADEVFELFSVPADGSAGAVQLNGTLVAGGDVSLESFTASDGRRGFLIHPAGSRVIYRADQDTNNVEELYSVKIDGSVAAVRLNPPLGTGRRVLADFQFGPDGARAFYLADQDANDVDELYGVASAGGQAPVKLSGPLVAGGDVLFFGVTPDSAVVLYVADQLLDNHQELFARPADGSGSALLLNALVAAGVYGNFQISADSSRAVYHAELEAVGVRELFASELASGGVSVKLNGPLALGAIYEDVRTFELAAGGDRAVYLADQQSDGDYELYTVPSDGSMGSTELAGPFTFGQLSPFTLAISPASERALYVANAQIDPALHMVPVDGSSEAIELSSPFPAGGLVSSFALDAETGRAVYLADQTVNDDLELYSVPVDGSAAPIRLIDVDILGASGVASFRVSPSGGWAAFLAARLGGPLTYDLYAVRTDGSQGPIRLSSALVNAGGTPAQFAYQISSAGRWVVYRADREGNKVFELFAAPTKIVRHARRAPARIRISAALSGGRDVSSFEVGPELGPGGTRVAYLADQDVDGRFELYSVPIDGRGDPVKLNAPLPPGGAVRSGFRFTADGARAVFVADRSASAGPELFSAPSDGSQPATRLSGELVAGGGVLAFETSPDGTRAVYLADQDANDQLELFGVPLDGSAAAVKLNSVLPAAGDVSLGFQITPDSSRVLYVADQTANDVHELFAVPLDGSAPPVVLNAPLVPGGSLILPCGQLGCTPLPYFRISADSSRVVYMADQEIDGIIELFSSVLP